MVFSEHMISEIESNLKLHINYKGIPSNGLYLRRMDTLTLNYPGPRGLALSDMLKDYYAQVGVSSLDEALERLRRLESDVS